MRHLLLLVFLFSLVLALGCGSDPQPYTDHSQDPEAYAKNVKHLVVRAAAEAKTSPEPADVMQSVVMELEEPGRPKGTYEQTYTEILGIARSLVQDLGQGNAKSPAVTQKLDELAKLAEKLPGDVPVMTPDVP